MALIDRVKERTGSDLSDVELNAMIAAITAELDARLGPVGPVTIELGDPALPHDRLARTLRLVPPIGVGAVTISEIEPGNSGDASAELVLAAGDYRVLHGGRTLQRLNSGPNPRDHWAPLVKITYTPQGVSQASRDEALIKLIALDLSYRGGLKSERAGDYSFTLSGDIAADREAVFKALLPAAGMVLA